MHSGRSELNAGVIEDRTAWDRVIQTMFSRTAGIMSAFFWRGRVRPLRSVTMIAAGTMFGAACAKYFRPQHGDHGPEVCA